MSNRAEGSALPWGLSVGIHVLGFSGMLIAAVEYLVPGPSNELSLRVDVRDQPRFVEYSRGKTEVWKKSNSGPETPAPSVEEGSVLERRPSDTFDVGVVSSDWWLSMFDSPRRDCPRDGHWHCSLGFCQPFRGPWPKLGFGNFTTTRRPVFGSERIALLICRCQEPVTMCGTLCTRCLRPGSVGSPAPSQPR